MIYAPVLVIVYTRKKNLENLINSLKENPEAKDTDIWIISDAASKKEDEIAVQEVREYAKSIKGFKTLNIVAPQKNSRIFHINHIQPIKHQLLIEYGKVILIEDDNIVSKQFLHYMNDALIFYKDYPNISAICGYKLPIKLPKDYKKDVYFCPRFSAWGYGITNEWDKKIDKTDFDRFTIASNHQNIKKFSSTGNDLLDILLEDSKGKIYAPDARTSFYNILNDYYCVFPSISMVNNVGFDGTGEHCNKSSRWNTILDNRNEYSLKMEKKVLVDARIIQKIKDYNNSGYFIRHYIKIFLKKIGLFYLVKSIIYKKN